MKKRKSGILWADIFLGIFIAILAAGNLKKTYTHRASQYAIRHFTGYTSGNDVCQTAETGIQAVSQEKKQVAITFDDGPDPVYTPELLSGLKERNVKATFFLLGQQVEQYPEIVKQMYEDGHEIGCHSYQHVDFSKLSEQDACEQIRKTCDLIYEITGERPSYVRPPYGAWLSCLDEDFCMIPVLWNVDPLDWATKDAALVSDRVLENTEEYDIILMHDASQSSIQAALQVIDVMEADGYEFVTVEELLMP